ncbi:Succinate dehydrogenase/fumarate reductase, flavoprotein subunit [Sinosporangium album]|uniref:Succinate dehydrogenase/fumarate reductase, flavoprotein subunit n=1 Tax=Sinosporangium album TaxID=504805 RepID=A0A1G7ZNP0_9ACTN|nr:FAD-binding protein [Sinosporangium album]SDH10269.1 Succinate dehydrogenase/fumarate reductase, flavoprotein subunit [Sinosporangium album]
MTQSRRSIAVRSVRDIPEDSEFDVVVLGAGAAGLAAAVFAGLRGARALIVESSEYIGGTSALTAGTLWLPGAHPTDGRSADEDRRLASRYLESALGRDRPGSGPLGAARPDGGPPGGGRLDATKSPDGGDPLAPLRERFLGEAAEAIALLARHTAVSFARRDRHPDYLGSVEGAAVSGRAIEAVDFDGRLLGPDLRLVRPPLRDFTIFGGLAPNRDEAQRYSVIAARPASPEALVNAVAAIPRVSRHLLDRLIHRRSSHLTLGNALIGRLLASLRRLGTARVVLNAEPVALTRGPAGVEAVKITDGHATRTVRVARAVISATGGFSRGARRAEVLAGLPLTWSAVVDSAKASAHSLLEGAGAVFERQGTDAFWAPISLVPGRRGGRPEPYPHFALDRGKPGFILVDRLGRRYLNESSPYHVLGEHMLAHGERDGEPSFLIADHRAVKRYGIGAVRPGGWGTRRRLRDGYLTTGRDLDELGRRLDMPPGRLRGTVHRFNTFAGRGDDPDFGRGGDPYQRGLGDARHRPNPSLGAVERPPFYAVRVYPGDIGSASGFVTDENAQALDAEGRPIGGLYVLGSDMRSIMGGRYPGPGITLGPAIVFASLAVGHALERRG